MLDSNVLRKDKLPIYTLHTLFITDNLIEVGQLVWLFFIHLPVGIVIWLASNSLKLDTSQTLFQACPSDRCEWHTITFKSNWSQLCVCVCACAAGFHRCRITNKRATLRIVCAENYDKIHTHTVTPTHCDSNSIPSADCGTRRKHSSHSLIRNRVRAKFEVHPICI